ncbi:MAG: FmdB family zinc ribbon protein [Anaerolineales bacterium]
MPIYEYHCTDCKNEFEKLMRFSDPNIDSPECPNCKSSNTHKRLSAIAAISAGNSSTSSSSCRSSGPFR